MVQYMYIPVIKSNISSNSICWSEVPISSKIGLFFVNICLKCNKICSYCAGEAVCWMGSKKDRMERSNDSFCMTWNTFLNTIQICWWEAMC